MMMCGCGTEPQRVPGLLFGDVRGYLCKYLNDTVADKTVWYRDTYKLVVFGDKEYESSVSHLPRHEYFSM